MILAKLVISRITKTSGSNEISLNVINALDIIMQNKVIHKFKGRNICKYAIKVIMMQQ